MFYNKRIKELETSLDIVATAMLEQTRINQQYKLFIDSANERLDDQASYIKGLEEYSRIHLKYNPIKNGKRALAKIK